MKLSQNCQLHNQLGFTLIEMMIVVAIIGILAAIASVGWAFSPAQITQGCDAGQNFQHTKSLV